MLNYTIMLKTLSQTHTYRQNHTKLPIVCEATFSLIKIHLVDVCVRAEKCLDLELFFVTVSHKIGAEATLSGAIQATNDT